MTNDLTVTKINNEEYTKYVRVENDQKYNVGGKKTFESGSTSTKVGMSLKNLRGIYELNLDIWHRIYSFWPILQFQVFMFYVFVF